MSTNEQLHANIVNLRKAIVQARDSRTPSSEAWEKARSNFNFSNLSPIKERKSFKASSKVKGLDWGPNNDLMTMSSGAEDSQSLVIWDTDTSRRTNYIRPSTQWLTFSRLDKNKGEIACCGGLDVNLLAYRIKPDAFLYTHDDIVLTQHDGYVADACIKGYDQIYTGSGDTNVRLFDLTTQQLLDSFEGHTSDVCCLANQHLPQSVILSGGCDFSVRLWDSNSRGQTYTGLVQTFDTKSRDVQGLDVFPDGNSFAAALSNSEVHMYDIRASCRLATFTSPTTRNLHKADKVAFSNSGRLLFAKYDGGGQIIVYDVTKAGLPEAEPIILYDGTSKRCEDMAVHPRGSCLAIAEQEKEQIKLYWPKDARR